MKIEYDYLVGYDHLGCVLKVEESKKGIVNVDMLKNYINAVRENLEERSKSKNNLENIK